MIQIFTVSLRPCALSPPPHPRYQNPHPRCHRPSPERKTALNRQHNLGRHAATEAISKCHERARNEPDDYIYIIHFYASRIFHLDFLPKHSCILLTFYKSTTAQLRPTCFMLYRLRPGLGLAAREIYGESFIVCGFGSSLRPPKYNRCCGEIGPPPAPPSNNL